MKFRLKVSSLVVSALVILPSCKTSEPASQTKFDEVVTSYDAPRYEFFLQVLEACLADSTQILCTDNLNPSVILPLRLDSSAESDKMKAAFETTPRVFACDPAQTHACKLELDRTESDPSDLDIYTDRREQLSKLTFTGNTLKIKMRLINNADQTKTIELCKIGGVKASKKIIFVGNVESNVIKAVFRYSSTGQLLARSEPIIVTVDTFGGNTTENCEF